MRSMRSRGDHDPGGVLLQRGRCDGRRRLYAGEARHATPRQRPPSWTSVVMSAALCSCAVGAEFFTSDDDLLRQKMMPPSTTVQFFQSLDSDADGVLRAEEIREFVRDVGGAGLDEGTEIEEGVEQILKGLDLDKDHAVTLRDLKSWFSRLGGVLTVSEAADWVVHALQLPPDIGDAFRENAISGYDFPDLLKDDGASLVYDLNVTRRSFRKRIMKGIETRLLGLGREPPSPIVHGGSLDSASAWLEWVSPRSDAIGTWSPFPVHKHVVQRRDWDGDGEEGAKVTAPPSSWLTVYAGPASHYTDTALIAASRYVYSVTAWNAIGHSEPTFVTVMTAPIRGDSESAGRHGSTAVVHADDPVISWWLRTWELVQWMCRTVVWLAGILEALLFTLLFLSNILRVHATLNNDSGRVSSIVWHFHEALYNACRRILHAALGLTNADVRHTKNKMRSQPLAGVAGIGTLDDASDRSEFHPSNVTSGDYGDSISIHHRPWRGAVAARSQSWASFPESDVSQAGLSITQQIQLASFRRFVAKERCAVCMRRFGRLHRKRHTCSQCGKYFCSRHGATRHFKGIFGASGSFCTARCICAVCTDEGGVSFPDYGATRETSLSERFTSSSASSPQSRGAQLVPPARGSLTDSSSSRRERDI